MVQPSNLADHHIETIFKLFQCGNDQECRSITLRGSDQVDIQASNLWMFSSLVRAVIGSSPTNQEALILLPDHHGDDIITALSILNTSQMDDIVFSANVKDVFNDLEVILDNIEQLPNDEEINMRESKEVIRNSLIDELINNKKVEEVLCYYCSRSFTGQRAKDKYRSHLGQSHYLSEMKEEMGRYFDANHKCSECGKTYVTASFKRKHLTKQHSYLVDTILKLVNRKDDEPILEHVNEVQEDEDDDVTEQLELNEHSQENLVTELLGKDSEAHEANEEDPKIKEKEFNSNFSSPEAHNREYIEYDDMDDKFKEQENQNLTLSLRVNPLISKIDSKIKAIADKYLPTVAINQEIKRSEIQKDKDSVIEGEVQEDHSNEEGEEIQRQLIDDLSDSDSDDSDDITKDVDNSIVDDIQRNLLQDQDLNSDSDSDEEEGTDDSNIREANDSNEDVDNCTLNESGSSNVSFNCKLCPRTYDNKNSLYTHCYRKHRKSKIPTNVSKSGDARDLEIDTKIDKMVIALKGGFKCFLCGKKYTRRHHIASHCESHLNYSHKCPHCFEKFKTRFSVKNHIGQKHK